jgi:uncharacterized protein (DUF2062 family)
MFKRRIPLPFYRRLKEIFWPTAGFRRSMRYVAHRLGRLPGTPYRIAAGFACGAAVSFTPFIGFHILLAMLFALLIRGNLIASGIGTVVGNPWTFPLIWLWAYTFGRWLLGLEGSGDLPGELTFIYIRDHPMHVLWPMTVGAIPTAIVAWVAFFLPMRRLVEEYQRARRWRIRRKVLRRRKRAQLVHPAEPSAEAPRGGEGPQ